VKWLDLRTEDGDVVHLSPLLSAVEALGTGSHDRALSRQLPVGAGRRADCDRAHGAAEVRRALHDEEMPWACTALARAYTEGIGVTPNPARVRQLLRKGCDTGDAQACAHLGPKAAAPLRIGARLAASPAAEAVQIINR
jgi:TPR repeat protein